MSTNLRAAETGYRYNQRADLEVLSCAECGLLWAMPETYVNRRRNDGRLFYCPNGHGQLYRETEEDRQRKRAAERRRADNAEDAARIQRERADRERRTAVALRGHLTRMKNRIANGICPVPGCKRSGFQNVMRHVASKHPDWHHDHAEDLGAKR
jgi:hypothetical protein